MTPYLTKQFIVLPTAAKDSLGGVIHFYCWVSLSPYIDCLICLALDFIWKKIFSETLKGKLTFFLLLRRRMLGLSSSHNYKEVVNSKFTKLDLIPYYSRPRSSSIAITGKLHPFGQHRWNNRKRDSFTASEFERSSCFQRVHFVKVINLP